MGLFESLENVRVIALQTFSIEVFWSNPVIISDPSVNVLKSLLCLECSRQPHILADNDRKYQSHATRPNSAMVCDPPAKNGPW